MLVKEVVEVLGTNPAKVRRDIRAERIPVKAIYGKENEYHILGHEFAQKLQERGFSEEAEKIRQFLDSRRSA